jgi:hypothetical protein
MTVADIKGRKEVLDAIAEFDRLGRDRFLEKYKFGPSRSYWLVRQANNTIPRPSGQKASSARPSPPPSLRLSKVLALAIDSFRGFSCFALR